MGYDLGVDLGTSFVSAAIANESRVEMFRLGDRAVAAPALVLLREDGTLISGDAAGRSALTSPERICREFKRRLGDPTPVMVGGTSHSATSLLATLLQDVVAKVTESESAPPESIVLTHPASWGPLQQVLFEEVPVVAGLTTAWTVTEAEAATAHYAASRTIAEGEIVAVYDLGGNTFDSTVLRKGHGGMEVLGFPEGIERLGGVDFDEVILSHLDQESGGALTELDVNDPHSAAALARLRQDCVHAKETLSVDTGTDIQVFLPHRHFGVELTRAEFEDMIRAPIASTVDMLVRTLHSARVEPHQLSAVLLVGGSSSIPLVSQMISERLGRVPVLDGRPEYAVAMGAAILGRQARTGIAAEPATVGASVGAAAGVAAGVTVTRPAPAVAVAPTAAIDRPPPEPAGAELFTPSTPTTTAPDAPAPDDSPAPEAAPDDGPPDEMHKPGRRRILTLVAAALIGVALIVLAGVAAVLWTRFPSGPVRSTTAPAVAASVPNPTVGPTIPVGPTPGYAVAAPDGRQVYIANRGAGVVTVLDTATRTVTATIPVPAGPPQYLTFSPDGRRAYVSIWNDARTIAAVGVLDTTTNTVATTIPVSTRPYLAAVTPDGKQLYVPNHDSGTISVIDTTTDVVTTEIKVAPNPHWVELSQDGSRAYMANHESNLVSVLDTADYSIAAEIPVQASPHSVALHPTRPLVANVNYDAASVTMIDTNTEKVIATIAVGTNPQDITWAPDGRFAYVVNASDNTVSVIDAEAMAVTATISTGTSPSSVAVLPDGTAAYVTNLGDGTVTVLNIAG